MKIERTDTEYEADTIKEVRDGTDCWEVGVVSGGWISVSKSLCAQAPEPGGPIRFYGRGFGYPIRGIVIADRVYSYQTEEEFAAAQRAEWATRAEEEDRKWEAGRAEFDAEVAKLPTPFQKRISWFLEGTDRWGARFGGYELFCCKEAVRIAEVCKTPEDVQAFAKDDDRQKAVLGDSLASHSGNTFGMSCLLANIYREKPELLWQTHGALCPLVGCSDYGCWASRRK